MDATFTLTIQVNNVNELLEFFNQTRFHVKKIEYNISDGGTQSKPKGNGARKGIQETILNFLMPDKEASTAVLKALLKQSGYSANSLNNQLHLMSKAGLIASSKKGMYHAKR